MKELLALVRSALENRPLCGPDFDWLCQWDSTVWNVIRTEAKVQSVFGLVYQAVSLLPPGTPIPENILFILVAEGESVAAQSRSMSSAARTMTGRMTGLGLHPRVMKGEETARFYPEPSLRGYGDIDLLLPEDEVDTAISSLEGEGYAVRKEADGSFHFEYDGIDVDVHTRYYDLSLPPSRLPEPFTPEGTILMLLAHALKHAMGVGAGLRQVCDVAAAFSALEGQYDPEALREACSKAGILQWTRLICRFLSCYLGIPDPLFTENRISPEPLLKLVQEGGNFGHHGSGRQQALERSSLRRKADTAFRFLRHLPFSLQYAPREIFPHIRELIRGNLD